MPLCVIEARADFLQGPRAEVNSILMAASEPVEENAVSEGDHGHRPYRVSIVFVRGLEAIIDFML